MLRLESNCELCELCENIDSSLNPSVGSLRELSEREGELTRARCVFPRQYIVGKQLDSSIMVGVAHLAELEATQKVLPIPSICKGKFHKVGLHSTQDLKAVLAIY